MAKRTYTKSGKYNGYYQIIRQFDNSVVAKIKSHSIAKICKKEFDNQQNSSTFVIEKIK